MSSYLSTERWARRSAEHPWRVVVTWVAVVVAAIAIMATLLASALTSEEGLTGNPDSKRAASLLEQRLGVTDTIVETVIVRSSSRTVDDPAFRRTVDGLYAKLTALGPDVVKGAASYSTSPDPSLVSRDRRATVLPIAMAGDAQAARDHIGRVLDVAKGADGRNGFDVLVAGRVSIDRDVETVAESDLQTGELIGIPAALLILLLVFGAGIAALVPVALAIVSIVVALGLSALTGQGVQLSFFVVNMITMMGLAVGIDYSLFVLSRYREERARGLAKLDAIEHAGSTATRAVVFSGVTVVVALVGMLLVPTTVFFSLAVGAILVVSVAVLAALTLLPALLSLLGDRVDALRVPLFYRLATSGDARGGFWPRAVGAVMRRPVLSLIATVAVLVAAAAPATDLRTGLTGLSALPDRLESKQGYEILARDFTAGGVAPAQIVIDGDIRSQPVRDAIGRMQTSLAKDAIFGRPALTENPGKRIAVLEVPINADASSDRAFDAIRSLRADVIPRALGGADATVVVGGESATDLDFIEVTDRYLPIVVAIVLGLSFLVLLVAFRSIVVPLTAIAMNLLSVGAAYGLLVLVTQKGYGTDLLGFTQVESVEAWIPLFLFSVLFGLSMDYHVFLLSRIRERFDATGDTPDAVTHGITSSARLITGAALIMVAVFGGFAAGELVMFQQMGFGLAVAVLVDATLVRTVLVPATMRLLGARNWHLPAFLEWLPRLKVERSGS